MTLSLEAFPDRPALMRGAADRIAAALNEGIAARGQACAALSGGSTPGPAYQRLAAMGLDWTKVVFALVDERCVPASDPASNEGLLRRTLAPALAAGARLLSMYAGAPSSAPAEAAYGALHIDLALMGMGVDGHTASWFPGAEGLGSALARNNPKTVVAIRAPQALGANDRLTLTRTAIDRAERVLVLIAGEDKLERLKTALSQKVEDAPVAALFARPGRAPEVLWAP